MVYRYICILSFVSLCFADVNIITSADLNPHLVIGQELVHTMTSCVMKCNDNERCFSVWMKEMSDENPFYCYLLRKDCIPGCGSQSKRTNESVMQIEKLDVSKTVRDFALKKPASQSSTNNKGLGAHLANDGLLTTDSATDVTEDTKWWQVDLQAKVVIKRIEIVLNELGIKQGKYKDLEIMTSNNDKDWVQCNVRGPPHVVSFSVNCDQPTEARYVRIEMATTQNLRLVEVKVFGC